MKDRMDYQVVIPSYRRSDQIVPKTLMTLKRQGVPPERITVFVSSEKEKQEYEDVIPDNYISKIVVGRIGVVEQRQFISDYFPKGTYIVSFDDDIEMVYRATGEKSKDKQRVDLPTLFKEAYDKMQEHGVTIWGVYAVDNPFFMFHTPEITTKLSYIVGALYGYITPAIPVKSNGGLEDKERSIRYFLTEGKTLRFSHISIKTKYYGKGGNEAQDRKERHRIDQETLVKEFPTLVAPVTRKNGYPDVRFKIGSRARKTMEKNKKQ